MRDPSVGGDLVNSQVEEAAPDSYQGSGQQQMANNNQYHEQMMRGPAPGEGNSVDEMVI